jgi:CTD kinase subunit gamma CTK3
VKLSTIDARATMADPFEVRMRFTHQLQHLNASSNSSLKAAHYALKNRAMDEDLHSCILEQLERVCGFWFTLYTMYVKREQIINILLPTLAELNE